MDNIRITIDTNAADAAKTFEQLSKSFDDSTKSSEDLRKQIKGLKDELYTLTPGTEEYNDCLEQLGAKMNQLSDTSQELRVATGGLDTVFQATTNATASLAAGFTAASGVVALFGGDTEDLQKTFVKLQAMMSIMNGLKGFAAFGKATSQASVSLKAFIAQSTLATKSLGKQAVATTGLATTEVAATGATTGLAVGFRSLTAAIASNPIGLLLVALAGAVTLFSKVADMAGEAAEAEERYNQAVGNTPPPVKSAKEELDDFMESLDEYTSMLRAVGVDEDRITEQRIENLKEERDRQQDTYNQSVATVEQRKKELAQMDVFVALGAKWGGYLKDVENAAADASAAIAGLNKEIANLENRNPESMKSLNLELEQLSNTFKVKLAGGLATQGDYLRAQIKVYQDAKNELWETVGAGNHAHSQIKGANEEERRANKALSVSYSASLAALQVELDAYNAGVAKKNRDAAQKLADELEKNYDQLINSVKTEASSITARWNEVLDSLDFNTFTLLPKEERMGRLSAQVLRFEEEIDGYLETWRKLADKAKTEGKINEDQFDQFVASMNEVKEELINSLTVKFDESQISESVRQIGQDIQNSIADIKSDNENMLKALSAGLISKEDYREWLVAQMQSYQEITSQVVETNNPTEAAFIQASKAIIPPEVEAQMTAEVKAYYEDIVKEIDKGFKELEDEYKHRKDRFDLWVEDQNRSWLEGAGKDENGKNITSYWGDSATATYNKMKKQNEELFNLLHQQYEEEIAFLQEKVAALDGNVEAQEEYNRQIEALRQADSDALQAKNTADLAAMRQYGQNVIEMAGQFGNAVSGLTSAMGSYYAEMAEQAKDANGNLTEESRKYLKKEGNMKIAQVWVDAATGIMSAWATSEQLGPIAGPILAAIQTAALLATAVASTQQIKRQTQANASGGASTANVSGITDRVVFGEAQAADQQAQLNGQYSQGDNRVYVVEGDINNAQNNTRTAVTNNTF